MTLYGCGHGTYMNSQGSPLDVRRLPLLLACLPPGISILSSSHRTLFPGPVRSVLTCDLCDSLPTSGGSLLGLAGSRLPSSISIRPTWTCSDLLRLAGPGSP